MDGRVEYRHYDADSSLAVNGLSEFLGADFQGRSFMFDCVVLNVCMKGSAKLKINDKETPVSERGIFSYCRSMFIPLANVLATLT